MYKAQCLESARRNALLHLLRIQLENVFDLPRPCDHCRFKLVHTFLANQTMPKNCFDCLGVGVVVRLCMLCARALGSRRVQAHLILGRAISRGDIHKRQGKQRFAL